MVQLVSMRPTHSNAGPFDFQYASVPRHDLADLPIHHHQLADQITYDVVRQNFDVLCGAPSSYIFEAFASACFPTLEDFNYLIMLYFKNINRVITVFHFPTLALHSSHWVLSVTIAAEGCQYLQNDLAMPYTTAMREFLRRAFILLAESDHPEVPETQLAQAKILHLIALAYSGNDYLMAQARKLHREVVGFCLSTWQSSIREAPLPESADLDLLIRLWEHWRDVETVRRVGYLIWIVDCMLASHLCQRPLLKLADAVPLPYPEVLWETSSAVRWHELMKYSDPSPPMSEVIQELYIEKKLRKPMGEFSHILVIYALYHRVWEVRASVTNLAKHWNPAWDVNSPRENRHTNGYIPAQATDDQWTKATYESLKQLQLAARGVIGAASGHEHPTVCHLYLAPVALLAPVAQIQELAHGMATGEKLDGRLAKVRDVVKHWAHNDPRQARLVAVSAGLQFWHIRKFSAEAFYEPYAVLFSTLALWAFGQSQQSGTTHDLDHDPPIGDDGAPMPMMINLDRPADDELIELFVSHGDRMLALMSGIGNVCGPAGPKRILLEGINMLKPLNKWGCSTKAITLLDQLSKS